jgi:hypothetical protein
LIACHARWVLHVLQQLPQGSDMRRMQEVALRCLRNAPGEKGVTALYRYHVEAMKKRGSPPCAQALPNCTLLLRDAVDDFIRDTDSQLRQRLWHATHIVVWYDEAQCLEGKCPVFVSR